jgi:hypothetical protein
VSDPSQPFSDALRSFGASFGVPAPVVVPAAMFSTPFEDLITVYTVGTAIFSDDRRFVSLEGDLFQLNEAPDGRMSGAWELKISLEEARGAPPPAKPPYNRPQGRVPETPTSAFGKGRWDFGDGSSITVSGPGIVHTTTTSLRNNVIWLSGDQIISSGTGRFEGAAGTKTAGVGIWLPATQSFEQAKGPLEMKSLDVFRVIPADAIGLPPQLPG